MLSTIRTTVTFALVCLTLIGTANAQQSVEVSGRTMGPIPFRVLVTTDDQEPEKLLAIKAAVNGSLQRVNELMSTYLEDSDISKFNRADSTDWQSVDPDTVEVVARAIEIAKLTEGAFDPTVGPAVNEWNFGPNKKEAKLPSEERLSKLKSLVGYQTIEVRAEPAAIRKSNPQAELDLSAIAKGYAVDRVGQALGKLGYENYMVVVGGEVMTRGERAQGGPWNVAVEKPESTGPTSRDVDRVHRVVKLSGRAIATSGDYRNFFEIDGTRYSHSIDPKTCAPVDHEMAIASVIADDCMTADAIATAVMVMGQEKGAALCEKLGYPLLTVHRSDTADGRPYITEASSDFPLSDAEEAKTETEAKPELEPESQKVASDSETSSILPVFLATFFIFCLFVLGMAVGAIFNNKPVTGSCGGIANMTNEDGEAVCGICSKPTVDCTEPVEA